MKALLAGATDSKAYCYIPMPFDRSAKLELVYRGIAENSNLGPLGMKATIYYNNFKRNVDDEGKFYAWLNSTKPPLGKPHVFLDGKGKGHYIGTLLQSQATEFTHFTEFFEGDDVTTIDEVMVMHGTGSEDYFNGGWYAQPGGWVERLGGPLSGCLDYNLPLSRTGGYRFFVSDKMNFTEGIRHTIEHGPENNNREVNYTSVALYYAPRPIANNTPPVNPLTKVFIPDTITFYTRLMRHLTYNGGFEFRNGASIINAGENISMNINVSEVPKGRYKIYLHKIGALVTTVKARIADAAGIKGWLSIDLPSGNGVQNVLVGETEITDNSIPVSILFSSQSGNPGLAFDRVLFIKQ